ncbi:MAG: hypothetical protein F9K32_01695 [Desulfobulbaceae bacterium]|nr:MAG: hypothetical protein F9K32_01695 [Desulfobulbaceae bacterium]
MCGIECLLCRGQLHLGGCNILLGTINRQLGFLHLLVVGHGNLLGKLSGMRSLGRVCIIALNRLVDRIVGGQGGRYARCQAKQER